MSFFLYKLIGDMMDLEFYDNGKIHYIKKDGDVYWFEEGSSKLNRVKKYGTSEGAIAAWDTRGRGKEKVPTHELNVLQYYDKHGIEHGISGISRQQYAGESKAGKARLDVKRYEESSKQDEAMNHYRSDIMNAYDKGEIDLNSSKVSDDAKDIIQQELSIRDKEKSEKTKQDANISNSIKSINELKIGDNVYHLIYSKSGVVDKLNKNTARIKFDDGSTITSEPKLLTWKKP
jgi:hypothetical protein